MRVIAHRGSSARAPENTLAAFRAALEDGADGVELDARLTADEVVVVMHDDDVSRTTNGTGCVSEMSFEQVRALRVSGSELIPTLEEVLALVGGSTGIVVEIKGAFGGARTILGKDVARAVVPLIEEVPDVTASSFDPDAVAAVRALAPAVPTAITISRHASLAETLSLAIDAQHAEIHLPADHVDQAFVERAHDASRAVLAYTVNDRAQARALEQIGIDGIFSDDPAAIR